MRPPGRLRASTYFSDPSAQKYLFYLIVLVYVIATSLVVVIEPFLTLPCAEDHAAEAHAKAGNPLYYEEPCDEIRYPVLLFFTRTDCLRGRNLLMAVVLGSVIGYERRSSDRPAGIRTMALVSLGSALFTINSTFGFLAGPMTWDASRVSAAIPSGVGFLGGGLIVKSTDVDPITGERHHLVQGITTAAATWLSAAVGIACGGGLYFVACFTTALNLTLLRFGPRGQPEDDASVSSRPSVGGAWATLVGPDEDAEAGAAGKKPLSSYGGADGPVPKSPACRRSRHSRPSLM